MNDLMTKYLTPISPDILIVCVVILLTVCLTAFKNRTKLSDFCNTLYNRRKKIEEFLQALSLQKELSDAQKSLTESVMTISHKIDELQRSTDERFRESEQKNNKRIRAELKDKISRSYRYYHSLGKITDMELEALEDLIEEYESADGRNSFVHSIVQKEMYTWDKA